MVQRVTDAAGTVHEFPDEATPDMMAQALGVKAPAAPAGRQWSDVPGEAANNALPSAGRFARGIYDMVAHPLDTVQNILDVGAGAMRAALPKPVADFIDSIDNPAGTARVAKAATAAGGFLAERYGSEEALKKTLATDPVGALSDLSALFTGGGASVSRVPGMARAGQALSTAGRIADPIALPLNVARAAEPLISNTIGLTTGAQAAPLREAFAAGRAGGQQAEAFTGQMRGTAPAHEVVDTARAALANMRRERGQAYRSGMVPINNDPTVLNFAPIDQAIRNVADVGVYRGRVINRSAEPVWQQIAESVDEWRTSPPDEFHTVEGLDALKKRIGDIRDSTQSGTPSRRIADEVYGAVRQQIVQQAPDYARVMADYEHASDLLREVERAFSLGERGSIDTALRKLQSIMRNNANTNYGQRVELGAQLHNAGADTLFAQLAGQALNSPVPRGMQSVSAIGAGLAGVATNPAYLPGLAAASPRLMGEASYFGGRSARLADQLRDYARRAGVANPARARALAVQLDRMGEDQPQE